MDPIVVDPKINGMFLSDYLELFEHEEIPGSYFYPGMNVKQFLERVYEWSETNYNSLPDLFLPIDKQTKEVELKVRLPYTNNFICPRSPKHKIDERRVDVSGRVFCNHYDHIKIPLGLDGFSYTMEWDSLSAQSRPKYDIVDTLGPFNVNHEVFNARLKDKKPVLIVQTCNALISDRDSLLPLEYIIRKENAMRNSILATYSKKDKKEFTEMFRADEYDSIPKLLRGAKLTDKRELLSFPYSSVHQAYLVKLWFTQGKKGSAPLYREVNVHGSKEDSRQNT